MPISYYNDGMYLWYNTKTLKNNERTNKDRKDIDTKAELEKERKVEHNKDRKLEKTK